MIITTTRPLHLLRMRRWTRHFLTAGLLVSLAALAPVFAWAGTETTGSPPIAQKK